MQGGSSEAEGSGLARVPASPCETVASRPSTLSETRFFFLMRIPPSFAQNDPRPQAYEATDVCGSPPSEGPAVLERQVYSAHGLRDLSLGV